MADEKDPRYHVAEVRVEAGKTAEWPARLAIRFEDGSMVTVLLSNEGLTVLADDVVALFEAQRKTTPPNLPIVHDDETNEDIVPGPQDETEQKGPVH